MQFFVDNSPNLVGKEESDRFGGCGMCSLCVSLRIATRAMIMIAFSYYTNLFAFSGSQTSAHVTV